MSSCFVTLAVYRSQNSSLSIVLKIFRVFVDRWGGIIRDFFIILFQGYDASNVDSLSCIAFVQGHIGLGPEISYKTGSITQSARG